MGHGARVRWSVDADGRDRRGCGAGRRRVVVPLVEVLRCGGSAGERQQPERDRGEKTVQFDHCFKRSFLFQEGTGEVLKTKKDQTIVVGKNRSSWVAKGKKKKKTKNKIRR